MMKQIFLVGVVAIVNMLFLPSREFYCNLGPGRPKLVNVLKRKKQIRHPEKMVLDTVVIKNEKLKKE